MLNQAGMCRGKQGNELLIAERPVQKAADQRRQRRPMPCCSSPLPTKRDAAPRVRSALHRRRPRSSRRRMPARTPALFSSANARTTARLLQGSSFLPSFLCFVFTYCTSLFMQQAEQGKEAAFCCCPLCFLCLLLLRLSEPCVYQRSLFEKKKQRREEEQLQEEHEEGKAAAAQAASALTHRPASSSSSSKCSSSSSSKCSSSSKYRAAMQQMQQQQSHSPRPIAQLTKD